MFFVASDKSFLPDPPFVRIFTALAESNTMQRCLASDWPFSVRSFSKANNSRRVEEDPIRLVGSGQENSRDEDSLCPPAPDSPASSLHLSEKPGWMMGAPLWDLIRGLIIHSSSTLSCDRTRLLLLLLAHRDASRSRSRVHTLRGGHAMDWLMRKPVSARTSASSTGEPDMALGRRASINVWALSTFSGVM
jgi:hypothetical protein